jgi:hypothetical protein
MHRQRLYRCLLKLSGSCRLYAACRSCAGLLGQYSAAQFTAASDCNGGTLISDPPAVAMTDHNPIAIAAPHHA